ncbi:MAG: PAS domain S-box protein [Candidatus Omnitrophica bacterium]|nr:PAS domain S-box protein [Candidatus Omnitrophota bacterium]
MDPDQEKDFLDSIVDSVIALDKEGKIRELNQATLNLLGYKKKEDLITLPFEKICKNFSLKDLRNKIPLAEQELMYLNKEGKEIPASVNISMRASYPDDTVFMARDISKIKELVDELTRSQEGLKTSYTELKVSKDDLVRSEKLAYTGRIAASIAHEIRNPLTNVSMSVQQLKKGNKIKQEGFKHVDIVERNIERINYLITELLNCARPAKLNLKPYDIHKVLKDVLESNKAKIDLQKIKVTKNFSSKLPVLKIDREQIERAFLNLITNAIEAMPRGGNLTIITELNGNFFRVKIHDTGKGIPEKDIIKIFDPFFSTKPQGVGLGLSICYGIIVSHGGTIEVESKSRIDSTFTVSLPTEQRLTQTHTHRERVK